MDTKVTMMATRNLPDWNESAQEWAPVVPWEEFVNVKDRTGIFQWNQGQHVAMIGPTGRGKTTLSLSVLPLRKYIVALATKPRDETLEKFGKQYGFKRYKEWPEISPDISPRRLLWPDARSLYSAPLQQVHFRRALNQIYSEGNWCVYVDELWYIIHHLKLEFEVRTYLQQARSNGISFVATTQRPAFVPLEVYDQSTHLFFWRDSDEVNLKRISGISWLSASRIRSLISRLEEHQVLYINTVSGFMCRTTAPVEGGK
jgi:hypothetical protein